jgi:hypothetical protein
MSLPVIAIAPLSHAPVQGDSTVASKGRTVRPSLGALVPAMQECVRKANIAEFNRLLAETPDLDRRRVLLRLLAEEKEKGPPRKRPNDD